jgi:hypothetical protein
MADLLSFFGLARHRQSFIEISDRQLSRLPNHSILGGDRNDLLFSIIVATARENEAVLRFIP